MFCNNIYSATCISRHKLSLSPSWVQQCLVSKKNVVRRWAERRWCVNSENDGHGPSQISEVWCVDDLLGHVGNLWWIYYLCFNDLLEMILLFTFVAFATATAISHSANQDLMLHWLAVTTCRSSEHKQTQILNESATTKEEHDYHP